MQDQIILFVAQKAIIVNQNKILILREAESYKDSANIGKWGVPGGRIKPGEHIVEALKREVFEESGLDIVVDIPLHVDEWFPQVRGEQWQIVATFRLCQLKGSDHVTLSDEHDSFEWIGEDDIEKFNLMPEDVRAIRAYFSFINRK
jgi:ADP-ribose pyrophosphatase YjhB (NUDIX family)